MRSFEPTAGHEAVRCKAAARHCAVLLTAALIAWSTLATNAPAAAGAAPPPARSPGCSVTGQPTGMLNGQTRVRGESRTYLMQVPANYQASRAYPLIFVFHGAGGNGRQAYGWGLQNAAGAADNAIFVYPDAITFQHYGIGWDDGPDGHDLPFFDGMLKDIEATRCIDTSRVFAAGFSWGGDFVITLACHRGDVIRAVAANSTDDEYNDTKDYRTHRTSRPRRSCSNTSIPAGVVPSPPSRAAAPCPACPFNPAPANTLSAFSMPISDTRCHPIGPPTPGTS